MNEAFRKDEAGNGGIPRLFEFGTAYAMSTALAGLAGNTQNAFKELHHMALIDLASSKLFAAAFAFGISALSMAFAIVPASPAGLIA